MMKLKLVFAFATLLSPLALAGCYGADFTPTGGGGFTPVARAPEEVQVRSERPGPSYVEIGLLTGTGGSFEGAIKRIKQEAGDRGCEVVVVVGEAIQSGYGTPGAAYGMSKNHVRAVCYAANPDAIAAARGRQARGAESAAVPSDAPVAAACAPACRLGFDCLKGACVSACNPACPAGQECTGHGAEASCKSPVAGGATTSN